MERNNWLILAIVLQCLTAGVHCQKRSLAAALNQEVSDFAENGQIGDILNKTIKELDLRNYLYSNQYEEERSSSRGILFCSACTSVLNKVLKSPDIEKFQANVIKFCLLFNLGNREVCEGLVYSNIDDAWYIVGNSYTSGKDICGMVFAGRGCNTGNPDREFEVSLPEVPKPRVTEPPYPKNPKSTFKILHLADTHYDSSYTVGSYVDCDEFYLCCRQNSTKESSSTNLARKWGSYGNCDLPIWTLETIYEHISRVHTDIDFIIWTGDIVPHNVWDISKEFCVSEIREMTDLVHKYFPNTPVIPAVGNHESSPVNLFPQPYIENPEYDISWLYDELASVWSRWLPAEVARNVSYGAFYSMVIKPGLKVISLNTNYCYNLNWWLIMDSIDVAGELDTLAKQLQLSEDAGEKVYIIGHIPPGNKDCMPTWSHQFNRIISRYENTVTGLFFGHTHNDHFHVFFDPDDVSRAYEVAYIAQSQTTYRNLNPGYKIYTTEGDFDGSYFRVLDHENWILDLGISNENDEPHIVKSYSAKEEYGMTDLSPDSWKNMVLGMTNKKSLNFNKFYRNFVKSSPSLVEEGCNRNCKSNLLCELLTSDTSDNTPCKELL